MSVAGRWRPRSGANPGGRRRPQCRPWSPPPRSRLRHRAAGRGHAGDDEEVRRSRRRLGRGQGRQARGRQGLRLGQRRRPPAGHHGFALLPGKRQQGIDRGGRAPPGGRRQAVAGRSRLSACWAGRSRWTASNWTPASRTSRCGTCCSTPPVSIPTRAASTCTWAGRSPSRRARSRPSPTNCSSAMRSAGPWPTRPARKSITPNFGFFLAREVIQRVSGQPYERYVRRARLAARRHQRHGIGAALAVLRRQRGPALRPRAEGVARRARTHRSAGRQLDRLGGGHGAVLRPPWTAAAARRCCRRPSTRQMLAAPPAPLKPRENGSHFGLGWDVVLLGQRRHPLQQERRCARHPRLYRAPARRTRLGRVAQRRPARRGPTLAAGLLHQAAPPGDPSGPKAGRSGTSSSGILPPPPLRHALRLLRIEGLGIGD